MPPGALAARGPVAYRRERHRAADRDQSALLRHLRDMPVCPHPYRRTQARLARRLRDTGQTERVGGGASRPSRIWRTERRVVGPGQLRGYARTRAHAGIPNTAQPSPAADPSRRSPSAPTGSGRAPRHRAPAAPHPGRDARSPRASHRWWSRSDVRLRRRRPAEASNPPAAARASVDHRSSSR
jgi:hypothetical protein